MLREETNPALFSRRLLCSGTAVREELLGLFGQIRCRNIGKGWGVRGRINDYYVWIGM